MVNEMSRVKVYSTRWCGYCVRAKALLASRGIEFEEVMLDQDPTFRQHVYELSGRTTVPLITVDGEPIGGYAELHALDSSGRLQELLAA
jgi:glutaredoxin 3